MELYLRRTPSRKTCTISPLFIDDTSLHGCWILEDVVREVAGEPVAKWKVQNETAIPRGRYKVVMSLSKRFKKVTPELLKVPGFTGIRIHAGNKSIDTEGCLIAGTAIGDDNESVTGSRIACNALVEKIAAAIYEGEEVWITVG